MSRFFSIGNLEKFCENNPETILFAHYAKMLLDNGETENALEVCQLGVDKHPDYPFGRFVLGQIEYQMGNFEGAKRELEIALAKDDVLINGWSLLAQINKQIDSPLMAKEAELKLHILDPYNEKFATAIHGKQHVLDQEGLESSKFEFDFNEFTEDDKEGETIVENEVVEPVSGSDEASSEVAKTDDDYDFGQTLDEVFKDEFSDESAPQLNADIIDETFESDEDPFTVENGETDETEEADVSKEDEEFSSAMDSFFTEYENETEEGEFSGEIFTVDELAESVEEEEIEETSEEETAASTDIFLEEFIETPEEIAEQAEKTVAEAAAEEIIDDESADVETEPEEAEEAPMDFSSVVADIISEREELVEENNAEPLISDAEVLDDVDSAKEEVVADSEEVPAVVDEELIIDDAEPQDETDVKAEGPQFGRPPILSPTLGEIYIAQGRFDEAIDVFEQLLSKDPENSRYERKIADLKTIVDKQKSTE